MPISTRSTSQDVATAEVDTLVVGAGAAGMTAALVSSLEGLDVLLCEKSDRVGGTTATSAGTIWVPGTRQSREAGSKDEIVDAKRYLDAVIGAAHDPRRDAYLETGPRVVDYLDRRSEVKFAPYARHPDYLANRPGATTSGRALAPLPFDGRLLGADFELVRPPIGEFMALGGMMIGRDDIEPLARPFASLTTFRVATSLLWRQATDRLRYRRGTRLLMGNALVARLLYSLHRNSVPIWLNASLQELIVAAGRVCGAVILVQGNRRHLKVRRGIVLATGGFGGSVDRLNDYVRPLLAHIVAFAGAAGDGIRMARKVGAAVEDDHVSRKGSTKFDRHNGDPHHAPNPCLGRIETPPYLAMAVYPSTLGSSVGLRADPDGRVLTEAGEPIPGLFVCGNDMASIMRGHYPGPGITLGPALVFAYRAAMAIKGD